MNEGRATKGILAAVLLLLMSGHIARAADPMVDIFGGFSIQPYSQYGYAGGVAALNGNITTNGFLTRLSIGVGGYSYQTLPGMRQAVSLQQSDAMLGYQFYLGATRLIASGGVELMNHENADQNAVERGATIGGKGLIEVYSPFSEKVFGWGMATLSSNYTSYFSKAKVGYRLTDRISIGPEGMAQGSTQYDQTSAGGAVSWRVLGVELQLSGGYLWDLRSRGGASSDATGLYGAVGLSGRF
jgi:hypothetical protein